PGARVPGALRAIRRVVFAAAATCAPVRQPPGSAVDPECGRSSCALAAEDDTAVTTPIVSVLMTAYNRASFIAPAIESVLAQTFADFELVIVDDCSTDDTPDIARRYARLDSRVRVLINERNLGDYGNRNHAAALGRGQFLKFHDSDDMMYPHCL